MGGCCHWSCWGQMGSVPSLPFPRGRDREILELFTTYEVTQTKLELRVVGTEE